MNIVSYITLQAIERLQSDAGVLVVAQSINQSLTNRIIFRLPGEDFDSWEAHSGIKLVARSHQQQLLDSRVVCVPFHSLGINHVVLDGNFVGICVGNDGLDAADTGFSRKLWARDAWARTLHELPCRQRASCKADHEQGRGERRRQLELMHPPGKVKDKPVPAMRLLSLFQHLLQ